MFDFLVTRSQKYAKACWKEEANLLCNDALPNGHLPIHAIRYKAKRNSLQTALVSALFCLSSVSALAQSGDSAGSQPPKLSVGISVSDVDTASSDLAEVYTTASQMPVPAVTDYLKENRDRVARDQSILGAIEACRPALRAFAKADDWLVQLIYARGNDQMPQFTGNNKRNLDAQVQTDLKQFQQAIAQATGAVQAGLGAIAEEILRRWPAQATNKAQQVRSASGSQPPNNSLLPHIVARPNPDGTWRVGLENGGPLGGRTDPTGAPIWPGGGIAWPDQTTNPAPANQALPVPPASTTPSPRREGIAIGSTPTPPSNSTVPPVDPQSRREAIPTSASKSPPAYEPPTRREGIDKSASPPGPANRREAIPIGASHTQSASSPNPVPRREAIPIGAQPASSEAPETPPPAVHDTVPSTPLPTNDRVGTNGSHEQADPEKAPANDSKSESAPHPGSTESEPPHSATSTAPDTGHTGLSELSPDSKGEGNPQSFSQAASESDARARDYASKAISDLEELSQKEAESDARARAYASETTADLAKETARAASAARAARAYAKQAMADLNQPMPDQTAAAKAAHIARAFASETLKDLPAAQEDARALATEAISDLDVAFPQAAQPDVSTEWIHSELYQYALP